LAEYAKKTDLDIKVDKTTIVNISQINNKYDYANRAAARNAVPAQLVKSGQMISYQLATNEWVTERYSEGGQGWTTRDFSVLYNSKQIFNTGVLKDNTNYNVLKIDVTNGTSIKVRTVTSSDGNGGAFYDVSGAYISGYTFTTADGGSHGDIREITIPANAAEIRCSYPKDAYATSLGIPVFSAPEVYVSENGNAWGQVDIEEIYNLSKHKSLSFASKADGRSAVDTAIRKRWQTISYIVKETYTTGAWVTKGFSILFDSKQIFNDGSTADNVNYNVLKIDVTNGTSIKVRTVVSNNGNGGAFYDVSGTYISGYTFTTADGGSHGDIREIAIPTNAVEVRCSYPKDAYATSLGIPVFSAPDVFLTDAVVENNKLIVEQFTGDNISQWNNNKYWSSISQDSSDNEISETDITGTLTTGESVIPSLGTFITNNLYHRSGFIKVSEGDILEITACLSYNFATANNNSCIAGYSSNTVDSFVKPILTTHDAGFVAAQHYAIDSFEVIVPSGINYIVGCSAYTGTGERNRNLKIVRKSGKRSASNVIDRNRDCERYAVACRKSFESQQNSNETDMPFFSHLSDIHGDAVRLESFLNYSKHLKVDIAFVTGDIVTAGYGDDFSYYKRFLDHVNIKAFHVLGNHEVDGANGTSKTDEQCHATYFNGINAKMGMINEGKCYYYSDLSDKKLRIIALNEFQYGGTVRRSRYWKPDQITWFINTLKSTPADYGIIILMHQPCRTWVKDAEYAKFWQDKKLFDLMVTNVNGDPIGDIMDAFIGRASINQTYTQSGQLTSFNVNADFSTIDNSIEFVAYLNGHYHADFIGYLDGTVHKQLVLNIAIGSAKLEEYVNDLPRWHGTPCEDVFNLYGIDRVHKVVKVARVGSNTNYMFEKRDFMVIPYT
jgi:hypothetical protein